MTFTSDNNLLGSLDANLGTESFPIIFNELQDSVEGYATANQPTDFIRNLDSTFDLWFYQRLLSKLGVKPTIVTSSLLFFSNRALSCKRRHTQRNPCGMVPWEHWRWLTHRSSFFQNVAGFLHGPLGGYFACVRCGKAKNFCHSRCNKWNTGSGSNFVPSVPKIRVMCDRIEQLPVTTMTHVPAAAGCDRLEIPKYLPSLLLESG